MHRLCNVYEWKHTPCLICFFLPPIVSFPYWSKNCSLAYIPYILPQPNAPTHYWRASPPLQALKNLLVCRNKPEHKTGNTVKHTLRRGDDNDNNNQSNMICKQTKFKTIKHDIQTNKHYMQTNINKQRFYKPILPPVHFTPKSIPWRTPKAKSTKTCRGCGWAWTSEDLFSMSDFWGSFFCSMKIYW